MLKHSIRLQVWEICINRCEIYIDELKTYCYVLHFMGFIAVRHICQVNQYSLELPDDLLGESVLVINTAKLAGWHGFVSASLEGQQWSNCVALQE